MKVKIAYTVDLDEVPQKIQELLTQSEELLFSKKTKDNFKKIKEVFAGNNTQAGLELLEAVRNNLMEIDIKLEDCTSVLIDYQRAVAQMNYDKHNEQGEVVNDEEGE